MPAPMMAIPRSVPWSFGAQADCTLALIVRRASAVLGRRSVVSNAVTTINLAAEAVGATSSRGVVVAEGTGEFARQGGR